MSFPANLQDQSTQFAIDYWVLLWHTVKLGDISDHEKFNIAVLTLLQKFPSIEEKAIRELERVLQE